MRNYRHPEVKKANPWQFDSESEASVLGSCFATAVAAIASGHKEELVAPKKLPTRKLYYDDKCLNPSIEFSHSPAALDAHFLEQDHHWKKAHVPLCREKRKYKVSDWPEEDEGPKSPIEYPGICERTTTTFGRRRQVRPFSRVIKNLDKPNIPALEAAMAIRNPIVNALSYRIPDLWEQSLNASFESSVFKSSTKRMDDGRERSASSSHSRRSMLRSRSKTPGQGSSSVSFVHNEGFLPIADNFPDESMALGEQGMQNSQESLFLQAGDHILGELDEHIRPNSASLQPWQMERATASRGRVHSPTGSRRPYSPQARSKSPVVSRPMSPTQDTIAHSKQPGFTFASKSPLPAPADKGGFKVFVREQQPNQPNTIRQTSFEEYQANQEKHRREVAEQLHSRALQVPPKRASSAGNAHPRNFPAIPLSFGATAPPMMGTEPTTTSSQAHLLFSEHVAAKHDRRKPPASAPQLKPQGSSTLGSSSSRMLMDDSVFEDESMRDSVAVRASTGNPTRFDSNSSRKDVDLSVKNSNGLPSTAHRKGGQKNSYNDVILSRWSAPMCYSKRKAQDKFPALQNALLATSADAPSETMPRNTQVRNPRSAGKSFQEVDYYLAQRRPKTTQG